MKNTKNNRIGSYCISCLSELKQDYVREHDNNFYCNAVGCPRHGLLTMVCYDREFIRSMVTKTE